MKKRTAIVQILSLLVFLMTALLPVQLNDTLETESPLPPSEAMQALEFWAAQRAYPDKVINGNGFYSAFELEKQRVGKVKRNIEAQDFWDSIGPANVGGRTNALAVDPQNPEIIYAGAASGGLWKLTMYGQSYLWQYMETGFPVLGVNAIAVDPVNSNRIYIGTGEVYGYQNSTGGLYQRTTRGSYGIGLLISNDHGETWIKSIDWSYHQERGILDIEINPLNTNVVFAGTTEGTYRTHDGGQTWEKVHSVLMAVDIAINPEDTNIVYVSCGNLGSPDVGIYRSVETGNPGTWTKLSGGLPSGWSGKTMLEIYRSSPNVIYADVADAFDTIGLYRSTNYGDDWTLLTSFDYARYQGWFSHFVRVNPVDSSKVICAGVYYYNSENGGRTLSYRSGMHVDNHAYANHPDNHDIIYFGNDGGVYRSLDGGYTFQDLNMGYTTTQFYNGFSSSTTDPNLALGGLQDNSTVMYRGALDWTSGLIGGDGSFTAINTQYNDILYGSSQRLNIWRSLDGGQYWENISQHITVGTDECFIAPYVLCPSHPWIMYAGNDFIHKSENMGSNWAVMNNLYQLNGNAILSIAVSPENPDVVYASTVPTSSKRAEVFASFNGAVTFQNITGDLPDRYYVDLQVSPICERELYVTLSGFGSSHLFRKEDGGQNWQDIGNGLPDVPTSAVVIDPEIPSHIYVGNDLGIYVSTDYGNSWQQFNDHLPSAVLVMDLSISPSNRKLRAVTHGNGVYERSLLSSSDVPDDPSHRSISTLQLFQNYPNPFNPETEIRFDLPRASFVTLKIFNILGEEIRILASNGYPAGSHTFSWDGRDHLGCLVSGGTYIYQIKSGDVVQTRKMVLIQ